MAISSSTEPSTGSAPYQEVDYFLCYAKAGKAHEVAVRAKEWFLNQGASIWDRATQDVKATQPPPDGDLEKHKNCVTACRIFVSKAVLVFIDFEWLTSADCVFDYNLAQLQNLTSSRPVIFPILCEDLSCCNDDAINTIINAMKHNLPPFELWNRAAGVTEEDVLHHIHYKLGSILLKHLPDLPKLPEYADQESRRASRASNVMGLLSRPPPEPLPSGKWVGFILGAGRELIGGEMNEHRAGGTGRWPLDCLLRMRPRAPDAGSDASNLFHGHGRDDVGLFMINGSRKGAEIKFEQTYQELQKAQLSPFTVHFDGLCRGTSLAGQWTIKNANDTHAGYWALWPERSEENKGWEHYVPYFRNPAPRTRLSSLSGDYGFRMEQTSSARPVGADVESGARKPMGAILSRRATEELSLSPVAEEAALPMPVAIVTANKTPSTDSLNESKRVRFLEDATPTKPQKPPKSPSFGVRLSFNTEQLMAAPPVAPVSMGIKTVSMPDITCDDTTFTTEESTNQKTWSPIIDAAFVLGEEKRLRRSPKPEVASAELEAALPAKTSMSDVTKTKETKETTAQLVAPKLEAKTVPSLERNIPIERERSPAVAAPEKSTIVIKEKTPLGLSKETSPLVIREEKSSLLTARGASPVPIIREKSPISPVHSDQSTLSNGAATPSTPSTPSTPATPVSPVTTVPVFQEMPIVKNGEKEGGARKKKGKRERKALKDDKAGREGDISIPVFREGAADGKTDGKARETDSKPVGDVTVPVLTEVPVRINKKKGKEIGVQTASKDSTIQDGVAKEHVTKEHVIPIQQTKTESKTDSRQESQSSSSSFNNSFEGGFGGDLLKDMNRMPGMSMRPMKRMDEMLGFGNMGLDMGMKDADFFSGMPGHPLPGMPGMLQGPDVATTTSQHSDSMNFIDTKDGMKTSVDAQKKSSQVNQSNQSVDPAGGSTTSTFSSSSFSSSSISQSNNTGPGNLDFWNVHNQGLMSPLSLTIPVSTEGPIISSPGSTPSETKDYQDDGPIVSEIIE